MVPVEKGGLRQRVMQMGVGDGVLMVGVWGWFGEAGVWLEKGN